MKKKERLWARIVIYAVGLCLYAWFVCLMTRAHAGISPITSVPYLLSQITPLSLGTTQFIVNAILVGVQILLLGKRFERFQWLQLVASLGFSVFIDVLMPTTAFLDASAAGLPMKVGVFALSLLGMSLGLGIMTICRLILLPGDGLAQAIALRLKWNFGKAKVLNDCIFVSITVAASLLILGRLVGIQWGTVVAALCLGLLVKQVIRVGTPIYQRLVTVI